MVVIISILFSIISAARTNAIRFQIECVADMGMQSSLAEYNRSLFDKYGLLFVDTGFGTSHATDTLLENHIIGYMDSNFRINPGIGTIRARDHLAISVDDVVVDRASCATDMKGLILEREAIQYMKARYGITAVQTVVDNLNIVQSDDLLGTKVDEAWDKYEEMLHREEENTLDENGDKIEIEKPHETVKSYRDSRGAIVGQTASYVNGISQARVNISEYISHRFYKNRNGFIQGENVPNSVEDLIFQRYIMEYCGKYTDPRSSSRLKYEVEYVIGGMDSDKANLENVLLKLLAIRECSNYFYIQTDTVKKNTVKGIVAAISCLLLNPELEEPLTELTLLAWSYAESISDLRALLSGKRIPLRKNSSSWRTSLFDALSMNVSSNKDSGGLSYEEYLHILLAMTNADDRRMRLMDVIEMNVRESEKNENFRIDMCLHDYEVTVTAHSEYGGSFNITKLAGFQK